MTDLEQEFTEFLKHRHEAAAAFVCGDGDAFQALLSADQGSFFSPMGPIFRTREETDSQYVQAARRLRQGEYRFDQIAFGVCDQMAWMCGVQWGSLTGDVPDRIAQFDLRVTEIFHREEGEWKLVHRHADRLQSDAGGTPR